MADAATDTCSGMDGATATGGGGGGGGEGSGGDGGDTGGAGIGVVHPAKKPPVKEAKANEAPEVSAQCRQLLRLAECFIGYGICTLEKVNPP